MDQAIAALRFDTLVPVWALGVLGAVCILALIPAVLRRARGAAWRALAFAVLLLWLAGPRLVRETREGLSDIGLLVLDDTGSMHLRDRVRLREEAAAAIQAQAARIPDLELRTVTLPEGGHDGTRLFATIDRALADIPRSRLAGVVAITDGQVHDVPKDPPPAPLHVLIPAHGEETDRRLRIVEAPGYGLVGHSVPIKLVVEDLGVPKGQAGNTAARLTIRHDGEPPIIESVPVGREQTIEVPITRAGPTIVDLQAETLPGEVSDLNNRAVVQINGVRDRLRVLLVSGEPNMGERTWRRLLKADPSVDLVHFTILRPPEKDDMTPLNELALIAFPVRELFQQKINEFDLIILDRFQNRGILPPAYLRNIADYVRQGGALLMSVGPEFTGPASLSASPLGSILPAQPAGVDDGVVEGPFKPEITPLGTRHPVTADLPGWNPNGDPGWGPWYRRIQTTSSHGEALMAAPDGQPLLLLDHVGQGRVAMLLSDQIWLWSRGHQGGGPQAELLRRIAHWTMKEPELEEESLTARIDDGKLTAQRRSTADAPPPTLTVTDPAGHQQSVTLTATGAGQASITLPAPSPGVWQVTDGTHTAYAAAAVDNPLEIADLRATATIVSPVVRASGGSVHWLDPAGAPEIRMVDAGGDTSGSGWIGLRRNHDHVVTGIAAFPLLPPWLALPLILGLAVIAWRSESR
jgi:hypothetical protein